jgi:hypothetical protein
MLPARADYTLIPNWGTRPAKNFIRSTLRGICVLVLTALSCNLATATPAPASPVIPNTGATATNLPAPTETASVASATDTPEAATEAPTLTATLNIVTISAASNGSLGILRGPSIFYDAVRFLQNGQTSGENHTLKEGVSVDI